MSLMRSALPALLCSARPPTTPTAFSCQRRCSRQSSRCCRAVCRCTRRSCKVAQLGALCRQKCWTHVQWARMQSQEIIYNGSLYCLYRPTYIHVCTCNPLNYYVAKVQIQFFDTSMQYMYIYIDMTMDNWNIRK